METFNFIKRNFLHKKSVNLKVIFFSLYVLFYNNFCVYYFLKISFLLASLPRSESLTQLLTHLRLQGARLQTLKLFSVSNTRTDEAKQKSDLLAFPVGRALGKKLSETYLYDFIKFNEES